MRRFPAAGEARDDDELHLGPHRDGAGAVGDAGAVEGITPTVLGLHLAQPPGGVKGNDDTAVDQCTILAMGSSMMSVAPWSLRAGIRVLMSALGTTVSTA